MADIIRIPDDAHRFTQKLLSWYANGTLDAEETAKVEAHLAACAECRAELDVERDLGAMIATIPSDVERGWAALHSRLESETETRRSDRLRGATAWLGRRVPVGWAVMAQAACLALVAAGVVLTTRAPLAAYHALGAARTSQAGNVVVIFKPTTSELQLRGALRDAGARLVDGPTASDAYVLRVADAGRTGALTRLRADSHVVLAEPIDGAAAP